MEFKKKIGTRAEVFNGHAERTTGHLTKCDLVKNSKGVIVSRKMKERAVQQNHLKDYLQPAKKKTKVKTADGDDIEKN